MKSLFRSLTQRSNQKRRCPQSRPLAIGERLENRQLLAADGLMLEHGVLAFHGEMNVAESVTVGHSADASEIVATIEAADHTAVRQFPVDDVDQFRFVGREMHDSLANQTELPVEIFMSHGHHSAKMTREMEAAFNLVRYGDVTKTAVQSGKWLDPATWGGGENMPADGDRVLIPQGMTVTVNGVVEARLMSVRVDGMLRFAAWKNTELHVDTMLVSHHGHLRIGSSHRAIDRGVSARLVIDDYNGGFETSDTDSPDYDPYKLGNGLISHGRVEIYGAEKTAYAEPSVEPSAGDQQLTFAALPENWEVGDELVIAGVTRDADGDETRTITALDTANNTVTLDSPLDQDHHTPTHTREGVTLKMHVANLTRNAIIETAAEHRAATATVTSPTGDTKANRTGDAFEGRGHVMFMHSNDVQVHYGGFYHLGRTNKMIPVHDTAADENGEIQQVGVNPRARYALHFHRAGDETSPGVVQGSVAAHSPGWGFVNHSSHVEMTSNVAYDAVGAGFVTEAGDEAGSLVGNLSIRNHGSGVPMGRRDSVDDFGHGGHGFWLQGTGVAVRDNIASGASDTGIAIWPIGIDGLGDTVRSVQVEQFANNTIYGSDVGFLVGQHENAGSEFIGTTIFGVNNGLEFFYPEGLVYRDTTIIGDLENPTDGFGIKMHHRAGPFEFHNTHVEGFERGFETPRDNVGNVIDGVYLNNVENFAMINGRRHFALELTIRGDVQFGTLSTEALAGRTQYNFVMEESESAPDIARYNHLVLPYQVILDYDSLESPQRIYFDAEQSPDHIVWPVEAFDGVTPHRSDSDTPEEFRGKTNAELQTLFAALTDEEKIELFSRENRRIYETYPDAYYSFAGGIRPQDSELVFRDDIKNGALQTL